MMTHRNYINMGVQITEVDPLKSTDEYVSFLPFAWIGEQMNSFGVAMATGITVNFPSRWKPSWRISRRSVPISCSARPGIYETIRSQIWLKIDESYWLNRKVFYNYFMKVGEKAAAYRMTGKRMPFLLAIKNWLGKQTVFQPLINQIGLLRSAGLHRRGRPGSRAVHLLPGHRRQPETDLRPDRDHGNRLHAQGRRRASRHGGQAAAGNRVQDLREGEILSRSASVTPGYYKLPDKTEELLEDGWLHSGDAGYIDDNGHLVVIDRVSDVMHTSAGDMFSPMFLENKLKFSPYIKEAVIFGDQRDYRVGPDQHRPHRRGQVGRGPRHFLYSTFMDLRRSRRWPN
jgi:long-chain acyl-CoA synthetase